MRRLGMNVNNIAFSKWYDANRAKYEYFGNSIEAILRRGIEDENLIIHSLNSRVKDKDSFLKKCARKKYSDPSSQMTDFVGLRVITYTTADVERACKIVEKLFEIDTSNSQNKADILGADRVGYLSHHFIVSLGSERDKLPEYSGLCNLKAEIQVRTILQHAWAEIEHDREYKFSGQLPDAIYRRFHLAAGNLEMIDIEFQRLSDEIDAYKESVKQSIETGNLKEIRINTVSLIEFLDNYFEEIASERSLDDDQEIIRELLKFGINTIEDIGSLLTPDLLSYILSYYNNQREEAETSYTFLLRSIMIMTDAEKYFKNAWQSKSWSYETNATLDFWSKYGVDKELIHKYITII